MLPFWLPRLRLLRLMQKKRSRPISASPTKDPMTIPAMAPPGSPLFDDSPGTGVLVELDVAVGAGVEKDIVGMMVGSTTPAHRRWMFEL